MAMLDLGNIRMNWRGVYDETATYTGDDAVSYHGSSFIAKRDVSGITPVVGDAWDMLAAGTDQLTQKGDVLTHDGDTSVRLPCGKPGQVLQVTDNNQLQWIDVGLPPSQCVWQLAKVNGIGGWHTRVYLMRDGTLKACGYGGNFSNGDCSGNHLYLPSRVATRDPDVRFNAVYSGGQQHYGLTATGEVWSWGYNNYGQLGHGDTANRALAARIEFFVEHDITIKHIVTGRPNYYDYGCAFFLTTQGEVYACGYNIDGSLGNGTNTHQYTPVRCGALTNIVSLAVSGQAYSVYAIDEDGQLWVWGWNGTGQLGLSDIAGRNSPILHPTMRNVAKAVITCGYQTDGKHPVGNGFVLLTDGTLWSTGSNGCGQLGHGDTTTRNSFSQIQHAAPFTDIVTGDGRYPSAGAITDNNELYGWGYNGYGQLGTGNTAEQHAPTKPSAEFQGSVDKVCFGGGNNFEGCIVQAGNALFATGYSGNGNLGTGSTADTNSHFKRVLGQSGDIQDWGCFGQGRGRWGLSVLYSDGRVDACGDNQTYGETGTQAGNLHNVAVLKNVIF